MSDDLHYPAGTFTPTSRPLSRGERAECVSLIDEHPASLRNAVAGLDDVRLDTPYRDGGWTVRQVVHHLADAHLNGYLRTKMAIMSVHPPVQTYDQETWAECEEARTAPIGMSLELLKGLHARWASFLRSLEDADFRRTLEHPEAGMITVDFLLELYAWHGRHHTAHITALRERLGW